MTASRKKLTLRDIGAMLEHIVKYMITKEDLEEVNNTLDKHTKTLDAHTRDLNVIKNDVKTSLDKRMQLEVRVTNVEKKVGV